MDVTSEQIVLEIAQKLLRKHQYASMIYGDHGDNLVGKPENLLKLYQSNDFELSMFLKYFKNLDLNVELSDVPSSNFAIWPEEYVKSEDDYGYGPKIKFWYKIILGQKVHMRVPLTKVEYACLFDTIFNKLKELGFLSEKTISEVTAERVNKKMQELLLMQVSEQLKQDIKLQVSYVKRYDYC